MIVIMTKCPTCKTRYDGALCPNCNTGRAEAETLLHDVFEGLLLDSPDVMDKEDWDDPVDQED